MEKRILLKDGEYASEFLKEEEIENSGIIFTLAALERFCEGSKVVEKGKSCNFGTKTVTAVRKCEKGNMEIVTCKTDDNYVATRITVKGRIIYTSIPRKRKDYYYFDVEKDSKI